MIVNHIPMENFRHGAERRAEDLYMSYGTAYALHICRAKLKSVTDQTKTEQMKFWQRAVEYLETKKKKNG